MEKRDLEMKNRRIIIIIYNIYNIVLRGALPRGQGLSLGPGSESDAES